MSGGSPSSDYGVLDVGYIRGFIRELAPAYLDHVAIVSGIKPPDRSDGFAWCDLGCGQGVTAVMLAAMYPTGQFFGIDLNAEHIDFAENWAGIARLGNAKFHTCDFRAALRLGLPQFDYITLHGVYTWVGPAIRADVRAFIDRHLKPGGLVYISYNALPGRAADLPLQRLVRSFAECCSGDSKARVSEAFRYISIAEELKATCITNSPMLATLRKDDEVPASYLAHEFLAPNWDALCVTDVRRDLRDIGLVPAGRAVLAENFDALILKLGEREALDRINNQDLRELMRDTFLNQPFRRDVFTREGSRLGSADQTACLLDCTFGLTRQVSRVEYKMRSRMLVTKFDTSAARNIVAALASGPRRLKDIVNDNGIAPADAIASMLLLCACLQVQPTSSTEVSIGAFNAAVVDRLGSPDEIRYLATPFGAVVQINLEVASVLKLETKPDASWRAFLHVFGIDSIISDAGGSF